MPTQQTVLVIGDVGRPEFQAAYALVKQQWSTTVVADVDTALQSLDEQDAPTLIVLAESRPGEISAESVELLRQRAPLARFSSLAGSWCEGEFRSGKPAPGVLRGYWHQWPARMAAENARQAAGRASSWDLPQTSSEEERTLWAATEPLPRRESSLVIHGSSRQAVEALAEACRVRGHAATCRLQSLGNRAAEGLVGPATVFAAALWDTTAERAAHADLVARIRDCSGGVPLVAVVGFPREDQVQRMLAAGCCGVVSKPFRLEDLYWQLDQAVQIAAQPLG